MKKKNKAKKKKKIEFDNEFALFVDYIHDGEEIDLTSKNTNDAMLVTHEINNLIYKFTKSYHKLCKKYPKIGLGDTMTDELVADMLYSMIH